MAENKAGRVVEEPTGYDHTPTERIPAQGDFPEGRTAPAAEEDPAHPDRTDTEPVLGVETVGHQADGAHHRPGAEPVPFHRADTEPLPEQRPNPDDRADAVDPSPVAGSAPEPTPAAPPIQSAPGQGTHADSERFFEDGTVSGFRDRWRELQVSFVDDPAQAVRGAGELVDEIMRELAERKRRLDEHWRGGETDTEELRVAIQEYRAFFNQLLDA